MSCDVINYFDGTSYYLVTKGIIPQGNKSVLSKIFLDISR